MSEPTSGNGGRFEPGDRPRAAGYRSGEVRKRLVVSEVEAELGPLETPEDAMRQLRQLVIWGAAGKMPGTVVNGAVRGLEVWLRAYDLELDRQHMRALERRVRELEAASRGEREP